LQKALQNAYYDYLPNSTRLILDQLHTLFDLLSSKSPIKNYLDPDVQLAKGQQGEEDRFFDRPLIPGPSDGVRIVLP
jgi:hypothetical protein